MRQIVRTFATTGVALRHFPPKRYNRLRCPTLPVINEHFHIVATIVRLNTAEHCYYLQDAEGWAIVKAVLLDFANLAGLRFGHTRTAFDNTNSPVSSLVGQWLDAPGHWWELPGTYCLNVPAREQTLRDAIEAEQDTDAKRALQMNLNHEINHLRKHAVAMSETGAMLRIVRATLDVAPTYSAAEIKRPFVVFRLAFDVANDEALQLAQRIQSQGITLFEGDEPGTAPSKAEQKLARALLERANPPPPETNDDGGRVSDALRDYNQRCIALRNKVVEMGQLRLGLSEEAIWAKVRAETGQGLGDLNVQRIEDLLARWRALPIVRQEATYVER